MMVRKYFFMFSIPRSEVLVFAKSSLKYSEYDENIYMKYSELFKIFTTTEAGKLYLNTWFG